MKYFRQFYVTFAVFMAIDILWLGFVAQPLYDWAIGDFLAETPQWWAAILFYILFVVGLMYFALSPALKAKNRTLALKNGALYGFFTYMTYELTNYAVIAGWSLAIVPIDIAWGVVLSGLTSVTSYSLLRPRK